MVDPSVPDGSFPLPALTLKRSGAVLDEAIAVIRNDRAARHQQPGRIFTDEELVCLLPCSRVQRVLLMLLLLLQLLSIVQIPTSFAIHTTMCSMSLDVDHS